MIDPVLMAIIGATRDDYARNVDPKARVEAEITQDAVNYNADAPRIVFEPLGERWVRRAGASADEQVKYDPRTHTAPATQPRQLYTRLLNLRTHVWGRDRTDTEQLLQCLARQSYALCYGSYEPTAGEWLKSSSTKRGVVYLFDAVLQIPVVREGEPRVPLDEMPIEIGTI